MLFLVLATSPPPPSPSPPPPRVWGEDAPTGILRAVYESTGGARWTQNTGWLQGKPCSANWAGIRCTGAQVTSVVLVDNKLAGTLPHALGALSTLERLEINRNPDVSGTLPASFGELSALTDVILRGTRLSGTLPASMGNLELLQTIRGDQTRLSGTIPASLMDMDEMYRFQVDRTFVSGTLPPALTAALKTIEADRTLLSGTHINARLQCPPRREVSPCLSGVAHRLVAGGIWRAPRP